MKEQKMQNTKHRISNTNNGITLLALIITIVLMLILASITVNVVINGGLFEYAGSAKNSTEISSEKETLQKATIIAEGTSKTGIITVEEMQKAINNIAEENIATAMDNGETIVVKFNESNRYYEIDNKGNVTGPVETIDEEYAGDITKGGTYDGSESKPFQITCIEDLVAFSIMTNGGNSELGLASSNFSNKYIILTRTLDFMSLFSYNDYATTIYGDLNTDGVVEDIRTELTKTDEGCIGFTGILDFRGTFDGKENAIENIYQYKSSGGSGGLGLFYSKTSSSITNTVMNLTLTGEIINKAGECAAISCNMGAAGGGKVINCKSYVNVTGGESANGIGYGVALIDGCINYGKIVCSWRSSSYGSASGIGNTGGCTPKIVNCINEGNVIIENKAGWYNLSGGIIGTSQYGVIVQNCINKGECDAGIVGWIRNGTTTISNCYDIGKCTYAIAGTTLGGGGTAEVTNVYYQTDKSTYPPVLNDGVTGLTEEEIKNNATFVETLNNNIGENTDWKRWKIGEDGYPIFE